MALGGGAGVVATNRARLRVRITGGNRTAGDKACACAKAGEPCQQLRSGRAHLASLPQKLAGRAQWAERCGAPLGPIRRRQAAAEGQCAIRTGAGSVASRARVTPPSIWLPPRRDRLCFGTGLDSFKPTVVRVGAAGCSCYLRRCLSRRPATLTETHWGARDPGGRCGASAASHDLADRREPIAVT